MNPLIKRLTAEAAAPLEDMLARLIKTAALIMLATGCAIAASVFLTIDLYLFLETRFGALIAAGSIAGVYLFAALVFLLVAMRRPSPAPADQTAGPPPSLPLMAASVGAEAARAPPRNPAFAANIDAAAAPVLNVLRDAGLDREVLAIEAGTEVAKQLSPFSLMAFAIGAGVLIGRSLGGRRPLF